jgi:hypothetical protein
VLRELDQRLLWFWGKHRTSLINLRRGKNTPFPLADLFRDSIYSRLAGTTTNEEVDEVLRDPCEEIFAEQLDRWYRDPATWPSDRRFDVFYRWFDYHQHSALIDFCDEPFIAESD